MPIRFPIDTQLKDGSAVRLALAEPKDIESLRHLYNVIVDEGTSFPHEQMPSDEDFHAYWFGGCGTVMAFPPTGIGSLELAGAYYVKGRLKKAASGVLAIFPCSRTKRTLRAKKRLRPCWTDFFEPTRSL